MKQVCQGAGLVLISALLWGKSIPVQATSNSQAESLCPAQLPAAIAAITQRPDLRASRWGILVETLDGQTVLYSKDADYYFIPGSNAKLLSTAAALLALGGDYRIRTSLYQLSPPPDSSVPPQPLTLQLVGRGDPTLTTTDLQDLAQQLQSQGITHIDQLQIEDTYFRGAATNPTWEWEDVQAGYGAPVNSVILNQNESVFHLIPQEPGHPLFVQWREESDADQWQIENHSRTVAESEPEFVQVNRELGSLVLRIEGQLRAGAEPEEVAIALPNPAENFLNHLTRAFTAEHIRIMQAEVINRPVPDDSLEVAAILSPPLSELLIETNQSSNNLYAEVLLKTLGVVKASAYPDLDSSLEVGLVAMEDTLSEIGVDPEGYALMDGSGLSRHNLVTPRALVQVLQHMAQAPQADDYRASLAVAGVSGTLQSRFRDTLVQGRLYGKTGALSGVAALSGYLDPPDYPPLVFSIILNQFESPVRTVRPAIDEIVLLLGNLHPCP